ncbi:MULTISPECIES: PepSY domain-containing protein [unclassified Acidovorax]|uniref:PepSY-associated TM helix domain-containing protein n=1 Tax=unclassified Acidovorax TaxID=2684926 RepID=UPI001C447250|nr:MULTISPECIES: PepSY-associated TM helix domain-containing protein [unclassified Acidovorax]MBV7428238.1 PepSY domain-containing protein [Acidovorax sp. sif0732]MBV7449495.1 PepSY domain-containing protein [Acidovorax sp. sif0715]
MKEGFRQCMAWLHTWVGLVVGWVLFFVFVTGTVGYFAYEIDRWMRPELPLATDPATVDPHRAVALAQAYLQANAPQPSQDWSVQLPGQRGSSALSVSWREPPADGKPGARGRFVRRTLDPATGQAAAEPVVRKTGGGHLLYRMHYMLHYVPYDVAIRLVGVCTMLMLMAVVTGVITHKKIFVDFFTFRPGKGQRSWLDAHNIISVTALPFFLMITYSGLVFFLFQYMPAGLAASHYAGNAQVFYDDLLQRPAAVDATVSAQPLTALAPLVARAEAQWGAGQVARVGVQQPGRADADVQLVRVAGGQIAGSDRLRFHARTGEALPPKAEDGAARETQDVLLALHEGRFAGPVLRWLYFASGLLGCAMIATGLVLWTAKRRAQQDKRAKAGGKPEFGFRLVECLNIGTVAGLPVAVAAYFWANRLIPADFATRREWEAHVLFITWGVLLLYPALRTPLRAWLESLWLAAAAFALLPLLNALTTDRHLGVTLPAGDWVLAGFDLTMLALGACLAVAARRVHRRQRAAVAPARARGAVVAGAAL